MSRNKKSAPRSRRAPSKSRRPPSGNFKRFLRAFSLSAVSAFSIASCALNPQWRDDGLWRDGIPIEPLLAQWAWPQEQPPATPVASTGLYAQTSFAQCRQFFPEGRPPLVPSGAALRELCFSSFAILHGGRTKTPVFVAQRLNRRMIEQARDIDRTDRFYAEARLPVAERAELSDYRGSGYSRGHMAAAGDMHDAQAMAQSFSLANMVPQHQVHNAGAWNRIEQDTRKYVLRARGDVYVFTGPVYSDKPRTIGEGRVAVPEHLYKVVYDAATGRNWVHWQENGPDAVAGPPITYADFVRRTGLHLLPQTGS